MARKSAAARPPKQSLFKLASHAASAQERARYEAERRRKYRDLFNTVLGREVLADFLGAVGFFAADTPNAEAVANYRNGARWAGSELLRAMGADSADALTRAVLSDDLNEVFNDEDA